MSQSPDSFAALLEAAGEAQLRMGVDRGLAQIERYLAGYAEFHAWCRVRGAWESDPSKARADTDDPRHQS